MSNEKIPFIGALFHTETNQFLGTCIKESLSVSCLNIQDDSFEIEVNLTSAIDKDSLTLEQVYVVIGIDVEFKVNENTILPGRISANMLKNRSEAVNLKLEISILDGKVVVMQYCLVPIRLVQFADNPFFVGDRNFVPDVNILKNIRTFDVYNQILRDIYYLLQDQEKSKLMTYIEKQNLETLLQELGNFKSNTFLDCFYSLQDLEVDNWINKFLFLMENVDKCRISNINVKEKVSGYIANWKRKEKFLKTLKVNDIDFEVNASTLQRIVQTEKVFILFFSQDFIKNNEDHFCETLQFFQSLAQESRENNKEEGFIAVDLDSVATDELRIPLPNQITIYHYSDGELKSMDYMSDLERKETLNFARCIKQGAENKPKMRGKFFMPCPNCFNGGCSMNYQEWVCSRCKNYIDFGFNNHLYCGCADGKGTSIENFEFMCNDSNHGADFVKFDHKCRDYFDQMKPIKNISIAILGQSGVGKSTWINGILNYMQCESIEDAKANKILTAVPTKIYITDDDYKTHTINLGTDDNEDTTNVGASGTQDCKTYCIRYKDYDIQLIDTPGLGDTRGIDQDRKNVKKILDHLRHFDELHGICILLKPNESKITILLEFCLKEILTHLHKGCANNIVFCFTYSRSTFYRPGETLPVLEKLLNKIEVNIQLNRSTIYCMDNESFKYLCTLGIKRIKYSDREEKDFEQSWNKSVEETKRLLDYVIQLKPHTTEETMTLNQAKRMVLSLARPVAEITHNIEMNIQAVNDQKQLIEKLDERDEKLMKNLYVPQIVLENETLKLPRTVCTADSCVKYHYLPNSKITDTEYATHCHPECYLKNVVAECYPNPDLKECWAMSVDNGEWCMICRCSWKTHMHITYDQKRKEVRVKDQSVVTSVGSKSDLRKQKQEIIETLEKQISDLNEEKRKIIHVAGKFAWFLKTHAITPFNDSFGDYFDYLIDREEKKRNKTEKDVAILKNLKKTKKIYEEEIEFLKTVIENSQGTEGYDKDDVKTLAEELYQLPIHGNMLKENMKVVLEAEENVVRHEQKNVTPPAVVPKRIKDLLYRGKQVYNTVKRFFWWGL